MLSHCYFCYTESLSLRCGCLWLRLFSFSNHWGIFLFGFITHTGFFIFIDEFTGTLGCFCDAKQIILFVPILQILLCIANKKIHWKNNYGSYNFLKINSYMTKHSKTLLQQTCLKWINANILVSSIPFIIIKLYH